MRTFPTPIGDGDFERIKDSSASHCANVQVLSKALLYHRCGRVIAADQQCDHLQYRTLRTTLTIIDSHFGFSHSHASAEISQRLRSVAASLQPHQRWNAWIIPTCVEEREGG